MSKFEIIITTVPYREKFTAEIWFGEIHVAEINQDNLEPEIELFDMGRVKAPLKDFQQAIQTAMKELNI